MRCLSSAGHSAPQRRRRRAGFSLTELLVASGIGLIVMASVASLFTVFGRALSQSQSTVDQVARLRAAGWKLRQDLAGLTCRVTPWLAPEAEAGYFECVEGPRKDNAAAHGLSNLEADSDDILMFTTRSPAGRFFGRYADANRTIESFYAEVAWFCREAGTQPVVGTKLYNLYRRQLLIVGYAGTTEFTGNSIGGTLPNNDYDISLRAEGGRLIPNTLGDLTKRENRFMHNPTPFPHEMRVDAQSRLQPAATFEGTSRAGEDLVLTNVVSFDMRVFDPEARAQVSGTITRYPGDPGYSPGTGAYGAYVDLGAGQGGRLARAMETNSRLSGARPTYDTWSQHYEFTAAGRSGLNSSTEYTTSPPYPVPLKGVEVRIRCYDPVGKQVRQVTVRQSFGSR
jgi:prepilin-type N-terminal cleavage/methylation domain-containing protein